jgi:hypothetical protein
MGKKKKLYNLRVGITDNAVKIKYLLQSAIYKPDSERETFILGELALELTEQIKVKSEKIGKILKH